MADFNPTTGITLYKGTKVSLQNQPYFTSEGAKLAWYNSHPHAYFGSYSYQRENRQYVRVEGKADDLRGYDMLSFRNYPGARTIFCRIIEVEFVNPNTTQITFETDAMQTFIDVITFGDSWVEREMVKDDWNGALPSYNNLVPEGLEIGEVNKKKLDTPYENLMEEGWTLVALSAYDESAEPNYNLVIDGYFAYGLNQLQFPSGSGFGDLLKLYESKGKLDGIIGAWIVPNMCLPGGRFGNHADIEAPTEICGYQPKNAKCFSGEFCKVEISNLFGDSSLLSPEYFFGDRATAQINYEGRFVAGSGGVTAYPSYYGESFMAQEKGVFLPVDVQTCYLGNAFANWVGNNKGTLFVNAATTGAQLVGALGSVATGAMTGNPVLMGTGASRAGAALYNSLSTLASLSDKAIDSASPKGTASPSASFMSLGWFGFRVYFDSPNEENIKSIDDFFTVYGYRTCRAKTPNVDTRPFWNYVKCAPACVSGPFTAKDKEEIEALLNAGVTFWHVTRGAVIGDYSMDNRG